MKKGVGNKFLIIILVLFCISLLSISFVSASWFGDTWNKITGKSINDNCAPYSCSGTSDGCCPTGCSTGSDIDCCTNAGMNWSASLNSCYSGFGTGSNCNAQSTCSALVHGIADGCCPSGCSIGSDIDCCTNAGKNWSETPYGPSCYSGPITCNISASCSGVSDGCCPNWCLTGSDIDCCTNAGKNWSVSANSCYDIPQSSSSGGGSSSSGGGGGGNSAQTNKSSNTINNQNSGSINSDTSTLAGLTSGSSLGGGSGIRIINSENQLQQVMGSEGVSATVDSSINLDSSEGKTYIVNVDGSKNEIKVDPSNLKKLKELKWRIIKIKLFIIFLLRKKLKF